MINFIFCTQFPPGASKVDYTHKFRSYSYFKFDRTEFWSKWMISTKLFTTTNGAHTLSISCTKSVVSCKASIFFSHATLQGSIFSPYCESIWHKLSQYGKKILYTFVYHIVYYLGNYGALHEITDLAWDYQMLSVCAPYCIALMNPSFSAASTLIRTRLHSRYKNQR